MSAKKRTHCFFIGTIALLLLMLTDSYSQGIAPFALLKKEVIEIDGKAYVLEKGEIEVPEDRTKTNSRTLHLPVQIIRAANPNAGEPIFWLDGGPGASNNLSTDKIASSSPSRLLANHDLVCIGYRGVDGSTVLKEKKSISHLRGLIIRC